MEPDITVTLILFAAYREMLGFRERQIPVKANETVFDLFRRLLGDKVDIDLQASTMFAVNEVYTAADTVLKNGDRVAFIPPVSGG